VTPAVILGLLALALLAAGSRLRAAVVAGAGLVGLALAEAVVILGLHGSARALAAVPAAALLLAAGEISFGLADGIRPGGTGDRRRQAGWVGGCAAGAAAAAFVVLGADAVALRRSAAATVAGAVLAGLVVWLLVAAVHARVAED
jgi:hypothetical protein